MLLITLRAPYDYPRGQNYPSDHEYDTSWIFELLQKRNENIKMLMIISNDEGLN